MRNKQTGFTLIETMIAVAVLAIIVSIAFSGYTDQVQKSRRADGKAVLLDISQQLERCYTKFGSYNHASCTAADKASESNYYAGAITSTGASTYSLTATAQNGQEKDTECGNLTLDQSGLQGISGTGDAEDCW